MKTLIRLTHVTFLILMAVTLLAGPTQYDMSSCKSIAEKQSVTTQHEQNSCCCSGEKAGSCKMSCCADKEKAAKDKSKPSENSRTHQHKGCEKCTCVCAVNAVVLSSQIILDRLNFTHQTFLTEAVSYPLGFQQALIIPPIGAC